MLHKRKTPAGPGLHNADLWGQGRAVNKENNNIIKFPPRPFRIQPWMTSDGWPRTCERCREPFILSFVACTVRDGRERLCHTCCVDWPEGVFK